MKIYIAGPMSSSGEPGENWHAAAKAAAALLERGHTPFIPQLAWLMHAVAPEVSVDLWREWSIQWLKQCDALLRLPGYSEGAYREEVAANANDIPIYHSIEEL